MTATITRDGTIAHLSNGSVSLVLEAVGGRHLAMRHLGGAVRTWHGACVEATRKRSYTVGLADAGEHAYPDELPFAYPTEGRGDTRPAALVVERGDGLRYCDLAFEGWEVLPGKAGIPGMPSCRAAEGEATTLVAELGDAVLGLSVRLYWCLYEGLDALTCHVEVKNRGEATVTLRDVRSACISLPPGSYDAISLYGEHTREANVSRHLLHVGMQGVASRTGSSSPQAQPFYAVCERGTNETHGEVWATQLVYSGNHAHDAYVDQVGAVRIRAGVNPEGFSWLLDPGETFCTPEAVVVHSQAGLDAMSQTFHQLYLRHLMPERYAGLERPVLLNSWESMYYDVSQEKIEAQARLAAEAGMELFVLDDGWFRADNSSSSSMGDWECNRAKLPGGIEAAADAVHALGMQFGLWFEPEAVGPTSELFAAHPGWVLRVPGYEPAVGRHEYLLDLCRPEVREHILERLAAHLDGGKVDYVKWDMNRPLADVWSASLPAGRAGEAAHRYVLGLYELLAEFGRRWPNIILEGCSSGGCRLDPGMLAYVAQNWASDNTDAFDRMTIQMGLSLVYPPSVLGAHVSAAPNHQTGRVTSLDARYEVARQFCLGYELDLCACSPEELGSIAAQIAEHKAERAWMAGGSFHRLDAPSDVHVAWVTLSAACDEMRVLVVQRRYDMLAARRMLRLPFVPAGRTWRDASTALLYDSDELMRVGLPVPVSQGDCQPLTWHMKIAEGF